jgi:hypothetical protein
MTYVEDHGPLSTATAYCHGCYRFYSLDSKHVCAGENWDVPSVPPQASPTAGDEADDPYEAVPLTFEGVFRDIFDEAFELLVERQRKYGPANVAALGIYGVFSRLAFDKVERLRRSMNGTIEEGIADIGLTDDFGDESVDDCLLDIANYSLILLALKRGLWGYPLERDT